MRRSNDTTSQSAQTQAPPALARAAADPRPPAQHPPPSWGRIGALARAFPSPASHNPGAAPNCRPGAGMILLSLLAVYFGLHLLARWLLSGSLQSDESELVVLTQDWRWGYGSQPPLYAWIQKGAFAALGLHVFALALVKNLLLWSIYLFVYLAAREVFERVRPAVLAAASVMLIPQIAWESQRDQTHLVLATACAAATLWVFVRLLKTGRARYFVGFGALAGLGLLSKYNYLLLPAGLLAAALSLRAPRATLLRSKALLAGLAFLLVTAPHLGWLLRHPELALAESGKFKIMPGGGLAVPAQGLAGFCAAAGIFVLVPGLLYAPLLWRSRHASPQSGAEPARTALRLLERALGFGLLLGLLLVVAFRVTHLRERWLQPLLLALPILLAGRIRPQWESRGVTALIALAGASAATVWLVSGATVLGASLLGRAHNLNIPYPALAEELRRAGFHQGAIFAADTRIGGNLRLHFPRSRVLIPESPSGERPAAGQTLIVWAANASPAAPAGFLDTAARRCRLDPADLRPQFCEVAADNGPKRSERLGFVLITAR